MRNAKLRRSLQNTIDMFENGIPRRCVACGGINKIGVDTSHQCQYCNATYDITAMRRLVKKAKRMLQRLS